MIFRSFTDNATVAPFTHTGDKKIEDLEQLATIIQQTIIKPLPVHEHPEKSPRMGDISQSAPKTTLAQYQGWK